MGLRRALYYALWPLQAAVDTLTWVIRAWATVTRPLWWLFIASNPLLLAFYLMRRGDRHQKGAPH